MKKKIIANEPTVLYRKSPPKKRQKALPPTGTCFNFSWRTIVKAVQEYRAKYGYCRCEEDEHTKPIKSLYVTDDGVQFTYND